MRKILWLTFAALAALMAALLAAFLAVVFWWAPEPAPLCPTDQFFAPEVNCDCPAGYRISATCTKPGLDHWQCFIVKKQLLQCVPMTGQ